MSEPLTDMRYVEKLFNSMRDRIRQLEERIAYLENLTKQTGTPYGNPR